jgi:flagellar basal-body rod modification protein FlgD
MSTKIDPNLLYTSLHNKVREGGNSILGKDDFLKILMTQLQNQDPLNPMEDKDFIAQMATFSSLEQMTNLTKTMESFVESNSQSQMIAYNQFVGKQVTWHKVEESEDQDNPVEIIEGQGIIKGIRFNGNSVEFIMVDGTILTPANISQVNDHTGENSSLVTATLLIGKKVTWGAEGEEKSEVVKSISRKDGSIWVHFEDGSKVEAKELIKIEL